MARVGGDHPHACGEHSLAPWGGDTDRYEGHDDGGRDYILPEGVRLGEAPGGEPALYDERGYHLPLYDNHGHPSIVLTDYGRGGHRHVSLREALDGDEE